MPRMADALAGLACRGRILRGALFWRWDIQVYLGVGPGERAACGRSGRCKGQSAIAERICGLLLVVDVTAMWCHIKSSLSSLCTDKPVQDNALGRVEMTT